MTDQQPESNSEQQLLTFEFDVVTLDKTGKERQRQRNSAEYFTEDLGNGVTLDMVKIPAGEFLMGSPESEEESLDRERPQHQVRVDSFFMGKYPVTYAQWKAVASLPKLQRDLDLDPSRFKGDPPQPPLKSGEKAKTRWDRPVEQVSWYDAIEFCARLSKHTGKSYCLPSEAQWEYACRAGTTTPFHFGETISTDVANYDGNKTYGSGLKGVYRQETTPVGSFQVANNFGLFDMHGNIWEWCADPRHDNYWHKIYKSAPAESGIWDEYIMDMATERVIRGGPWDDYPNNCRSAYRRYRHACYDGIDFGDLGFRVVCMAEKTLQ